MPFDADLGTDTRGRLVVLYSRCAREHRFLREETGLPGWDLGSGCRIYEYSFASQRERRIRSVGAARSSFLPSRSGQRIAFASREGRHVRLRVVDVQTKRIVALRGGTTSTVAANEDPTFTGPGPVTVDLRGRSVLFSWGTYMDRCPFETDVRDAPFASEVWLQALTGASRRIARGCTTSSDLSYAVSAPTRSGAGFLFAATNLKSASLSTRLHCSVGRRLRDMGPTMRWRSLAASSENVFGTVRDSTIRGLYALNDVSLSAC